MSELGKGYECEVCGTQVLVVKPGDGDLECDGRLMVIQGQRRVPSAD